VLTGPDPAPPLRTSSAQERRAFALAIAALTLCVVNALTVHGVPGAHGPLIAAALHGRAVSALPPSLAQRMVAMVVVMPLLLAARYPMLAWRIGWLALLLAPLVSAAWWGGWPWGAPQILATLATFCLAGLRQSRSALGWMWVLTVIPWLVWLVTDVPNLNGPVSATIVFAVVAIAVDSGSARLAAQRALTVQAEQTEAERDQRALLEERTRIARELHDVVAHHMSLVAVRAETAPYRLTDLPEHVRAEFTSLSAVAREALADMRRLLGVLRYDQPAALAPQPRLADVPALVDAARQAGVPVKLSVPHTLDQVPSAVGLCVYRIVQESLSNASQHAPGAAVIVSVDLGGAKIALKVANGPAGANAANGAADAVDPAGNGHRPGHGLAGMRERVALLGGSMSAGPTPDGGFAVSAVLPLDEVDRATADGAAGTPW